MDETLRYFNKKCETLSQYIDSFVYGLVHNTVILVKLIFAKAINTNTSNHIDQ